VLLAANGVEALDLITSPDAPDIALVLMDLLMDVLITRDDPRLARD